MAKNEDIAKELKTRLSELTGRLAEIDSELRKPLSADSEERATDFENQDALEGIKSSEIDSGGAKAHRRRYLRGLRAMRCRH